MGKFFQPNLLPDIVTRLMFTEIVQRKMSFAFSISIYGDQMWPQRLENEMYLKF